MFEISFWKILMVLFVAAIVLGPEQLPKLARLLGRTLGQVRRSFNTIQKEFHDLSLDEKKESTVNEKTE